MSRAPSYCLASAVLTLFVTLASAARAADPTLQECVAANEKSGPLKQSGKLREARANLLRCSAASCPAVVRDDCVSGATRLEQAIPTIVFVAQDATGNDVAGVMVTMDGQPLAERLDGAALEIDPGEHVFTFAAAGAPAVEKRLVVREGEKNRRERIALGAPGGVAPPPQGPAAPGPGAARTEAPSALSGQKTAALVVGGAGVVGVGVGAAFGLMANSAWNQAKTDCGVACAKNSTAQGEADDAHKKATISNIAFAVGMVGIGAAVALWVLAPSAPSGGATQSARLVPFLAPGGGGLAASGRLP